MGAEYCQRLFLHYWDYHMDFIFQFVNMVYHIDWFAYIKESLQPWNKPNLIMVYELFNVLLNCLLKFCWGFLHLCSLAILACSFLFCDIFVWFWYQSYCVLVELVWKYSFHCNFWKSFRRVGVQFSSGTQSCPTLCDHMNHSTPGLPVHHQLPEFTQTHVHWINVAIQPSHPLLFPSPPTPNPSQHQGLF